MMTPLPFQIPFNDSYLNRTPNKTPRNTPAGGGVHIRPEYVVWHETQSGNPNNPYGTLNWNLLPQAKSSYAALIARTPGAPVFLYVDEAKFVAWQAGANANLGPYVDWEVNVHSIGVEIDGKADGTPATAEQVERCIQLMIHYYYKWGIPIDAKHHVTHKEVTKRKRGYRSDPLCINLAAVIKEAKKRLDAMNIPAIALPQRFRVKADGTRMRSAPVLDASNKNVVRTLPKDFEFTADTITLGGVYNNDNRWAHSETGEGFVHVQLLEAMGKPPALPQIQGLPIKAEPRIRKDTFVYLLWKGVGAGASPAADVGSILYDAIVSSGLDPAVALAFFAHESSFGLRGICYEHDTKSWGNVRSLVDPSRGSVIQTSQGPYATYRLWIDGVADWCDRITDWYIRDRQLTTVEEIIPVYAPAKDNNQPANYIAAIRRMVDEWSKLDRTLAPYTSFVDPRFQQAWEASGGIWRGAGLWSPGYARGLAYLYNGLWHQVYERGIARLENKQVQWLLLEEAKSML